MKKVFMVRFSQDGVSPRVFTNVKALYNFLANPCDVGEYEPKNINGDYPFSYANILKALKDREWGFRVNAFEYGEIEIITGWLVSK
jgi:hypothetical protein